MIFRAAQAAATYFLRFWTFVPTYIHKLFLVLTMTIAHCHWLVLESIILMLIDSVGTDADWCWLILIDSSILNICTTAQANTAACKWTSLLPGSWSYHIWSSSSSLLPHHHPDIAMCHPLHHSHQNNCVMVIRELSFYIISIYLPCSMIVVVSWFSFWIDLNSVFIKSAIVPNIWTSTMYNVY